MQDAFPLNREFGRAGWTSASCILHLASARLGGRLAPQRRCPRRVAGWISLRAPLPTAAGR